MKSNFLIMFKTYRDKMMIRQQMTAKNPATNENERKETNELKQKPMKNFEEFNDEEER